MESLIGCLIVVGIYFGLSILRYVIIESYCKHKGIDTKFGYDLDLAEDVKINTFIKRLMMTVNKEYSIGSNIGRSIVSMFIQ